MAAGAKIIKVKIKSVGSIRKITRTMEMISVSKMKKAVQQALSVRPYAVHALELIESISKEVTGVHPLFVAPKGATKTLLVVVSSNKGLCGSYNTNVSRALIQYFKQNTKEGVDVVTVGKFSEKIARRMKLNIVASFVDLENYSSTDDTRALSKFVVSQFETGAYLSVIALFTNYVKASVYRPIARQMLPVRAGVFENLLEEVSEGSEAVKNELAEAKALYTFEPSASAILSTVVPQLLHVAFHQILTESHASEHSARMFAMKQATDAADDMLKILKLRYNRVRQDVVTQEIAEISSGAVALSAH
ncbi:MAG: ATP synthase F1 subunit gamma [Minisyncoccia bacterium]